MSAEWFTGDSFRLVSLREQGRPSGLPTRLLTHGTAASGRGSVGGGGGMAPGGAQGEQEGVAGSSLAPHLLLTWQPFSHLASRQMVFAGMESAVQAPESLRQVGAAR